MIKPTTGIAINDFKHKQAYNKLIQKAIMSYLVAFIYKPMFKMLKLKVRAINDKSLILEALRNNIITYIDGVFRSTGKHFTNSLSLEFEKLGATYNKHLKGYQFKEVPEFLLNGLAEIQAASAIAINQINSYLDDLQYNLDHYVDTMIFNNEVDQILTDANGQIVKNVRNLNIIVPELTDEQKKQITRNYTESMQYYIKKWTISRIIKMRQAVRQAVLDGYREDTVVKMLMKEYKIAKDKAKFLAQNETSIMLAQYRKAEYTAMGFDKFIWVTILDNRERPRHHELNRKICRFDNPPIIDERTGQRGLPGETYNCRCSLIPYRDDSIFNAV